MAREKAETSRPDTGWAEAVMDCEAEEFRPDCGHNGEIFEASYEGTPIGSDPVLERMLC